MRVTCVLLVPYMQCDAVLSCACCLCVCARASVCANTFVRVCVPVCKFAFVAGVVPLIGVVRAVPKGASTGAVMFQPALGP